MKKDTRNEARRPIAEETLAQHHDAMEVVTDVERCLDRHPDLEGDWIARIGEELPRLAETLRCHFAKEQEGPLFRQLPLSHPRFADRLHRLEDEHARILRSIEDVTRKAQQLQDPPPYEIRELNAAVQLLVATIRRHEAEENEIIFSAHWDEVGVGD